MLVINAWILYKIKKNKKVPLLDFQISVAESLLKDHQYRVDRQPPAPQSNLPLRLTERATFPEIIESDSVHGGRPQCEVCRSRKIRSQTKYRCKTCKHLYIHIHAWRFTTQNKTIVNRPVSLSIYIVILLLHEHHTRVRVQTLIK